MSRGKWILIGTLACVAIVSYFFWQDLHLSHNTPVEQLPDIVVENLNFRRNIEGRDWHVEAIRAEHESGLIKADSVIVDVDDASNDRRTRLHAVSGEFAQEGRDMLLHSIDGYLLLPERSFDIAAPVASYAGSSDVWTFDRGVVMQDETSHLSGKSAEITPEGVFELKKGAQAHWTIE